MTRVALILGLALYAGGVLLAQETYDIKLQRPGTVGSKWTVAGSASRAQTTKMTPAGGQAQTQENYASIIFEGELEILEIDKEGRVTKASCVVAKCVVGDKKGEDGKEAFPKGTKLMQSMTDKGPGVATDAGPVADELADLLGEFLPVEKNDSKEADDMFDATGKKVGDSWPADSAKIAASLGKSMGAPLDPKAVQGKVTLSGKGTSDGIDCLDVAIELAVSPCTPALNPDATVEKAEMSLTMRGGLPVDPKLPVIAKEQSMHFVLQVKNVKDPNIGTFDLDQTTENTSSLELHPVK